MDDYSTITKGMQNLHLLIYHAGYCAGAGLPMDAPPSLGLVSLLATIAQRHQAEFLSSPATDPPPPAWLLALSSEALPQEPSELHTAPLGSGRLSE